jgi:hypothetical protein
MSWTRLPVVLSRFYLLHAYETVIGAQEKGTFTGSLLITN